MAAIVMSLQKKRLRLITPDIPGKGKVLKSCVRCRQHKTRCDAIVTNPFPCTHCSKKNINCTLDFITSPPKRSHDVVEKLTNEVHNLQATLDSIIDKKNQMIKLLIERGQQVRVTLEKLAAKKSVTPSVSEIQSCLNSPASSPIPIAIDSIPTTSGNNNYTLASNKSVPSITISTSEALSHFDNYHIHFHKYLPVLPDSFFEDIDLDSIHKENSLLFWSIVLTSHLNSNNPSQYNTLCEHIKNLVVHNCWLNTPRSVYTITSLLILTTWPLPVPKQHKLHDNLSIKYLSLMKNLALQLGLHKLEFINEFSHKTKINIATESDMDNLIRERIYKFININSNYWLVHLGLSTSNYNGFQQDYIINKSANVDLFNNDHFAMEDNFINSLLKISLIQLKLNENMNDLIENPNSISKLINLNMFEIILDDLTKQDTFLFNNNLIKLLIEYTKLQLYIYSFSNVQMNIYEYKKMIAKCVNSCDTILALFRQEFDHLTNINELPIHYKFIIELTTLTLLRIYKSPLLSSIGEYEYTQHLLKQGLAFLTKNNDSQWLLLDSKLIKIIKKFDTIKNTSIMAKDNDSFFLVNRMKNYLVSSLHYELIWNIYENEKHGVKEDQTFKWEIYGLDQTRDKELINYIISSPSIDNL